MVRTKLVSGLLLGLAVLATITVAGQFQRNSATQQKIVWRSDLQEAHKEAVRRNRPLLLTFGADWCTFCQTMESETLANPTIAQYVNQSFVPAKMDIQKDAHLARILEVKRIPCTVALTPEADLLGRMTGCVEVDQLHTTLTQIEGLHRRIEMRFAQQQR